MGFTMGGVYERLQKDGVPLRKPGTRPIPVGDEVLVRLLVQGLTVSAMAERTGMNANTIYSRLRKYRGALSRKGKRSARPGEARGRCAPS